MPTGREVRGRPGGPWVWAQLLRFFPQGILAVMLAIRCPPPPTPPPCGSKSQQFLANVKGGGLTVWEATGEVGPVAV